MTDLQEYGKVSDCCGAPVIIGDLCSSCYEHCDPLDECDGYDEEINEALDSVTDFEQLTQLRVKMKEESGAMDEILSFLCELYAERDYYSRGGLIDAFRDKIQQYNVSYKNIPISDLK